MGNVRHTGKELLIEKIKKVYAKVDEQILTKKITTISKIFDELDIEKKKRKNKINVKQLVKGKTQEEIADLIKTLQDMQQKKTE